MPPPTHGAEYERLCDSRNKKKDWSQWGPYLAERQWGTIREDYSDDGETWDYFTHDHARSRAYRWGEDGLLGFCDKRCRLCFSVVLWNAKDSILKERLFGLTGNEGNHGEDVKEQYFYLDSTPTHSYMKSLYKYPQQAFPYKQLVEENKRRTKEDGEFEILDTEIFDNNEYFDVFVEYAKKDADDILIRITIENRANKAANIHLLPTLFFRNSWSWKANHDEINTRPKIERRDGENILRLEHEKLGLYAFDINSLDDDDQLPEILFTENETNFKKLYDSENESSYVKDAFHEYLIDGKKDAVNPTCQGTKTALHYKFNVEGNSSKIFYFRLYKLSDNGNIPKKITRQQMSEIFNQRKQEADLFYESIYEGKLHKDEKNIIRQAYAGLLNSKQFYYYIVKDWLDGEGKHFMPKFDEKRQAILKNKEWRHMACQDILSVPDKWEYPWVAAWDLAFHLIPFAHIDPDFAKSQLKLIMREWYMHANGQIMAYEMNLDDVNPPVIAWSAWRVYKMSAVSVKDRDRDFLTSVFLKLLLNFSWWVNRKDPTNKNLFSGGFMGLDNIGVFDRTEELPEGMTMKQSDGTSWIAFFAVVMLQISLELSGGQDGYPVNDAFQDISSKFVEHFVDIIHAINTFGGAKNGLWDDEDGFYYDQVKYASGEIKHLKVRSFVGLIPLLAVSVIESQRMDMLPGFKKRFQYFLRHKNNGPRQHILEKESTKNKNGLTYLLTIPNEEQLRRILKYLLDENEFLSEYGLRSLSKYHEKHPFTFSFDGEEEKEVLYVPAESLCGMYGGNSNWRGPIWLCINYLLVEALERYHRYYGDSWKVECPTRSGQMMTLLEVSREITRRLTKLFLRDDQGRRPCHGDDHRFQKDPHWRDLLLFHEYFHGDSGQGLGASHQTGWTALIIRHIEDMAKLRIENGHR
ncbi:unnamed protein product [Adineta steineri]|uniref:Mannosylglycerate hydrolase MGH1-like glycoside hydrolase domain-containing protein n=1 Tax=Adineta steineri TaxID=433720 RepID=A0A815NKS5_9BILA|nr:unnamed protein product [Adineta steineri]CAF1627676.1 unnamed protein product [Adineta steineri]